MELRRRKMAKTADRRHIIEEWKSDFIGFAKKLDVIDKEGRRLKVVQSPILKQFEQNRSGRDYVLKPRQVFMTTWELARDIWFFLTKPGVSVVILCQSDKTNDAITTISKRIQVMFGLDDSAKANPEEKLGLLGLYPDFNNPLTGIVQKSMTKWTFGDATLTITGAGATEKSASKKGRAGTIHRLHVTEVAFFEYADDTLTAILECIPGKSFGTEVIFESTPKGAAGYFYEGYGKAKAEGRAWSGYRAHFFRWFDQPEYREDLVPDEIVEPETAREKELVQLHKISKEQLKWYREKVVNKGQAPTDQEFPSDEETCWLFDGRLFFDREALHKLNMGCTEPVLKKLNGNFKIWQTPEAGHQYIVTVDPSSGGDPSLDDSKKQKLDPCAIVVLERGTGRHCATLSGYFKGDVIGNHAAAIGYWYNYALIAVERSSTVDLVHHALDLWKRPPLPNGTPDSGVGYPHIYMGKDRKRGFVMAELVRVAVLDALESAIRLHEFVTYDADFVKEAQKFVVQDDRPDHLPGAHDDRIIATAIAWDIIRVPLGLNHTVFSQAPSIAYERTPVSFEGVHTGPNIETLVNSEKQRWAGGTGNSGWGPALSGRGDMEGF